MENDSLNPEQSFQVINSMINTAKNRLADDGFLFIFWGWNVMLSALFHYVTLKTGYEWGAWVWIIAMPLGGVVSMIYGMKQKKKNTVKTYIDTYLSYAWVAFGIALVITLIFIGWHGIKHTYFFLMILYGIATMVSGGLINFKPLVFGSLFSFISAIASVFLSETDQLLCISVALLCSYIIPGHLLRSKYKSQHV
jgi:hypothetical protein